MSLRCAWANSIRLLASVGIMAGVLVWLQPEAILAEMTRLAPAWALSALALTVPPLLLSAWRWRFTAGLLGLHLGRWQVVREYYLASFLNQVLPGGVAGDGVRAWRHGRRNGDQGPAWRAVIIERLSGQLAVALLALIVVLGSPMWRDPIAQAMTSHAPVFVLALLLVAGCGGLVASGRIRGRAVSLLVVVWRDIRRSLLQTHAWPRQLGASVLVVSGYALVFVCSARAIGVATPTATLLALAPPVLLAMLIPLSVAGWGMREGAAAAVWSLAGLPPAQGVAVSLTYGVIVLLASLPGAWWLLRPLGDPAASVQDQIEQGVRPEVESPGPGTPGVIQAVDGNSAESGPARADQQRRHQQVQTIEHPRIQES
jgi:uncharacterized membrane protein YbhN (UPF0104 family)